MNQSSNSGIPEGYIELLTASTIFSMDLIGKNLAMNSIDAYWEYSDITNEMDEPSKLFVKPEQQEQALSILTSLDLMDFTSHHGK
jgi:hypothetical protein